MRIWLISDTHTRHASLEVPEGIEMVIHCGDESNSHKSKPNLTEALGFFEWYRELDIPRKIFVPGNHSIAVELKLIQRDDYPEITFLEHELAVVEGLKIFGSPYTPWFFNWAYNIPRQDLDAIWQTIPTGVDLLITHGPPKGILDVTRDWKSREPIHIGSQSLTKQVRDRIKPRIHAFGHLHDEEGIQNFGQVHDGGVTFINCSCCNLAGELIHHGVVVEMKPN